ncbi:MAG: hypothetical protein IKF71_02590 [Bacilli bacterium]|nr:hypothetical protein [Bacilli bacterium]
MKNLKYIVLVLAFVFMFPFVAFAEDEETTTAAKDDRVVVYFFHGATCSHCAEAKEWFSSIEEEYGSKFRIQYYEVWSDEDNAALMQKVSDFRGDDASGVPYIICGDQSWIGFSEDSMATEIKEKIDEMYNTPVEERYDVMALLPKDEEKGAAGDVLALIIILVVVGGIGFGIYKARKSTN